MDSPDTISTATAAETVVAAAAARLAASRQKNCNSCVQTKRRCDRRMPVCSRCLERKIPCVYSRRTRAAANQLEIHAVEPSSSFTDVLSFSSPAPSIFGPDLTLTSDYLDALVPGCEPDFSIESAAQSIFNSSASSNLSIAPFMDLGGGGGGPPDTNQWLVPVGDGVLIERPGTPVNVDILKAYQNMIPFCQDVKPWHIYDTGTRLHQISSRIKEFVTDMAKNNSTPFMHRHLYREYTPRCIMSCFTTSVLYENRTPGNTAMVMKSLHSSVSDLVSADLSNNGMTPIEKLAHTQALFLYQIIRLFDGDITLRAQGEKDMALFQTWLGQLCKVRDNLSDFASLGDNAVRSRPPKSWEVWIFAESVRRTIFMAFSVIVLYNMMKGSDSMTMENPGVWGFVHRWTLARSLWEAESSIEFNRLWRETTQFIISNFSLDRFLEHGKGSDVDKFTELFLIVFLGVEETETFIASG